MPPGDFAFWAINKVTACSLVRHLTIPKEILYAFQRSCKQIRPPQQRGRKVSTFLLFSGASNFLYQLTLRLLQNYFTHSLSITKHTLAFMRMWISYSYNCKTPLCWVEYSFNEYEKAPFVISHLCPDPNLFPRVFFYPSHGARERDRERDREREKGRGGERTWEWDCPDPSTKKASLGIGHPSSKYDHRHCCVMFKI